MKNIPLYKYPASFAEEQGELDAYRASFRANVACREAIEQAITRHYSNNRLHNAAVEAVAAQFSYERILYVLANTVKEKDWDARFSVANKTWAKTITIPRDLDAFNGNRNQRFVINSHSGLVDLFLTLTLKMANEEAPHD